MVLKLLVILTGLCFLHFRSYIMYSEWVSLRNTLQRDQSNRSVLQNFPPSVGKDVAHTVVKTLVNSGTEESLRSEKEVDWIMEVLCYGLTLQMTESDGEIVKGCVNIYLDWLTVLTNPKNGIPEPLLKTPEKYAKAIFHHFRNLFVKRTEGNLACCMKDSLSSADCAICNLHDFA